MRKYFSEFGKVTFAIKKRQGYTYSMSNLKVDACTIMRDPDTGRSRGFAFLTFEEQSSVNAVMVREHYLDGKAVGHSAVSNDFVLKLL